MEISASDASRALADVLLRESANLDSDELFTVSASMTAVRAAARDLEAALQRRGWGGDVLYGFAREDEVDDGVDSDEPDGLDFLDDLDGEFDDDDDVAQPEGLRLTYQSRHDFVLTDEAALTAYVAGRLAADGESTWTTEAVDDALTSDGPLMILAHLDGFGERDYSHVGLAYAGGQDGWREIPQTLWEMAESEDPERDQDQFPTWT